ncbi:hypothetical protein N790_14285 [Arenimonas malthae CC-JY-1]|uniref:AAA+ ATPase domain-containing protein n=1 Tax=Arenimonas malthae CC-JY-1 TaxID=1384054 RepID=A0A091BLM5_9GAMM|nr:ATP-binding protein [Arenimonas malthae]KFN51714.1 hypothetical protein N790_14285 [Arenimonas malthae CC-JY-1]
MTSNEIDDLVQALIASPGNEILAGMVLRACIDAGDAERLASVLEVEGTCFDAHTALAEAGAALLAREGRLDEAQALAPTGSATASLVKARQLLAAGDRARAREAYDRALAVNPTMDDPGFAAQLEGKVVSLGQARRNGVTSVANDDTGREEATRLLQPVAERIGFGAVGGLDEVKQQIRRRIITPFLKPTLFDRFRRRAGGGILMYGPPGCGKTLLARATAGECGATFLNVAISDVLDMYIGESERKLHALFEHARERAPAVIFFDEVEALGGKRQHSREAGTAKLVSQFLTELDGFAQGNNGVLVLGATNVPWAVDAAFRRPGRFDRVLFVPPPDQPAREQILRLELAGRPSEAGIDVASLARRTPGFSGADLRHLVETAVDEAIEESMDAGRECPLSMAHLERALGQLRPTTLEWLTTARNHARYANQGGQYDEVLAFLDRHGKP